jgi:hypothetical protein
MLEENDGTLVSRPWIKLKLGQHGQYGYSVSMAIGDYYLRSRVEAAGAPRRRARFPILYSSSRPPYAGARADGFPTPPPAIAPLGRWFAWSGEAYDGRRRTGLGRGRWVLGSMMHGLFWGSMFGLESSYHGLSRDHDFWNQLIIVTLCHIYLYDSIDNHEFNVFHHWKFCKVI